MKKPGSGHPSKERDLVQGLFITGSILAFLILAMLPSCKNEIETIRSLEMLDTVPRMTAKDIEILYSERGQVQIKLVGPKLISKEEEEPLLIFPDGFIIYFYDSLMNLKSTISADYGISHEKKKLMEARHNVVVENMEKEEKLNTEELFWDQNKEIIYSEKFVKITSGGQVITGDGLFSKEPFNVLEVKNPKGLLEIKEEPGK